MVCGVKVRYNNFMFDQLLSCFSIYKNTVDQQTGRIIDLLRRIPYFSALNSNFGADYLLLMIPIIQPCILHAGLSLLGESNQYLLIQGELMEEVKLQLRRPVQVNRVVDLRAAGVRYIAETDCKIIKIKKGVAAGLHNIKKLMQKERQSNQEMSKMKRLLRVKENKERLDLLRGIDFFDNLGEIDLLDLASQSSIKQYSQGMFTHSCGEDVERIGHILRGKVKLTFPTGFEQSRRDGVALHLTEGEWIGLEEHLWGQALSSNGEASSVTTSIVWIPIEMFKSKFNLKTNYQTMNQLVGLIQTKKALFDRSLDCRRKKNIELAEEGQALDRLNTRLMEKISAMVIHQQHRKKSIRKSKVVPQLQLPDHLLHRANNVDPTAVVFLPKLIERVNLFPQQYRDTAISVAQLREMQRLAEIAKIHPPEPRQVHSSFMQQNPQTIYKTILNKIPHTYDVPRTARFTQTVRESRSRGHSNCSIYNNFKIQEKGSSMPKSKTLYILP